MRARSTERVADATAAASERVADAKATASERVADAKATASERVASAKATASERAADAKAAASERVADAKAAAEQFIARQKPRLRGVSHEWAFFVSLGAGGALVIAAPTPRATLAVAIYAASPLGAARGQRSISPGQLATAQARRWMRRLDHSMIFLLIAGTMTPFALLVLDGPLGERAPDRGLGRRGGRHRRRADLGRRAEVGDDDHLSVAWAGSALLGFPGIVVSAGIGAGALIAAGGALYTTGAIVYARQRPDPNPAVFGYHEIFHLLVIAAAAAHFAAVAIYALPAG